MTTIEPSTTEIRPEKKALLSQNALAFLLIANLVVGALIFAKTREASDNAYWAAQNATRAAAAASRASYEAQQTAFEVQQLSFRR